MQVAQSHSARGALKSLWQVPLGKERSTGFARAFTVLTHLDTYRLLYSEPRLLCKSRYQSRREMSSDLVKEASNLSSGKDAKCL